MKRVLIMKVKGVQSRYSTQRLLDRLRLYPMQINGLYLNIGTVAESVNRRRACCLDEVKDEDSQRRLSALRGRLLHLQIILSDTKGGHPIDSKGPGGIAN